MIAVALPSRFFDHEEGLWGNLLRVLSTVIVSSLVASIGFAQDPKSEKTGRPQSVERDRVVTSPSAGYRRDARRDSFPEVIKQFVGIDCSLIAKA